MKHRTPAGLPEGRDAEKTLAQLQLEELVQYVRTHTEAVARLSSQIVNDVLLCELVRLDANGQATREFGASMGSVAITNYGTAVTVQNTGPGGDAPGTGPGIVLVPASAAITVNMLGTSLTVYGAAAALVHLQVFTGSQPPAWGRLVA